MTPKPWRRPKGRNRTNNPATKHNYNITTTHKNLQPTTTAYLQNINPNIAKIPKQIVEKMTNTEKEKKVECSECI